VVLRGTNWEEWSRRQEHPPNAVISALVVSVAFIVFTMEKRSAVAIEGISLVSAPPSNKKSKSDLANDEITFADIPTEVLTNSILPLVGDYQYRFVGPVNHTIHDAYISIFPQKRTSTRHATAHQNLTLFCYHDRHRILSLLALYPSVARAGDLATLQHLYALDAEYAANEPVSDYYHRQFLQLFQQTLQAIRVRPPRAPDRWTS
jgi:hypothetical protein